MALKNGRPDEALGDAYPFEDHYVTLDDGRTMHYIEAGRAGLRRPTFLLLHGNPTWSYAYRRFMEPLARIGRVIAVDHMGFGRSDHPTDIDYYTLDQHIQNLEEFAAKLKLKRVVPVVQDWGGPIGLGYATRHPEDIAGLVVLNTWAFTERGTPNLPFWFKVLLRGPPSKHLVGKKNFFVEKIMPSVLVRHVSEEVMNGYRHPFPNPASRAGIVAFPRMIPTDDGHADWATMDAIEKRLGDLDVPATIVWGLKDPAFGRAMAHAFHEILPQATAPIWLDEGGHYLQEDEPDKVLAAIEDLAKRL